MSFPESLGTILRTMGFAQLGFAFVAALGYALALNGSLSARFRVTSFSAAVAGAAGFAALAPFWVSGIALMGLGVVVFAAFAGGAWLFAAILGLDRVRVSAASPTAPAREPAPTPQVHSGSAPLGTN